MPLAYSPFQLHKNYLVIRSGFEPETHSLEGCCSIQLSYQTMLECVVDERRLLAYCGDRDSLS